MSELFADAGPAEGRSARRRPRRRGGVTALIILIVLAVLGGVGYWLSDHLARQAVQDIVADQVEAKLPEGVRGDATVTLGGGWAVAQIISGRFDEMRIDAPKLSTDSIDFGATAEMRGVPRNTTDPVESIAVTVDTTADQLSALQLLPGAEGDITLGDGTMQYSASQNVFGIELGYRVTVKPEVEDGQVLLTPVDAEVDAGSLNVDTKPIIDRILGGDPVRLCVADRLPSALTLSGVTVTPKQLSLTARGTELPLSGSGLSTLGTCS